MCSILSASSSKSNKNSVDIWYLGRNRAEVFSTEGAGSAAPVLAAVPGERPARGLDGKIRILFGSSRDVTWIQNSVDDQEMPKFYLKLKGKRRRSKVIEDRWSARWRGWWRRSACRRRGSSTRRRWRAADKGWRPTSLVEIRLWEGEESDFVSMESKLRPGDWRRRHCAICVCTRAYIHVRSR